MYEINTICDESSKDSSEPYLDSLNGSSRGVEYSAFREMEEWRVKLKKTFNELCENEKVQNEISKADYCGKTYAKLTDVATETKTAYQQLKCYKWWCPTCGGINGVIHNQKYLSVLRRINVEDYFIRQFVFTVPDTLRDRFKSKKMINQLLAVVQRLMEREFGDYIGDKVNKDRVKEKKYRLNKFAVAYLHLDGEGRNFNPHVNVHLIEHEGSYKLSAEKLNHIRESYKKALTHLLNVSIEQVNCHYSFIVGSKNVKQAIRYMTKPLNREMIDHIDMNFKKLLCIDLKNLRYIRFWGKASNSEYKKGKEKGTKQKKVIEINGEAYKFVAILSHSEFKAETEGKALSCTPEGFIIVLDDPPDIGSTG